LKPAAITGLLPLEPPPSPPADLFTGVLPGLAALLLAAAIAWWWQTPTQRRRRHLAALQRSLRRNDCDPRAIAAELDALLRDGLAQPRLQRHEAPDGMPAHRWQALLDTLANVRFGAHPGDVERLAELIPLARQVLRRRHGRP
jgi:hypothetical protein